MSISGSHVTAEGVPVELAAQDGRSPAIGERLAAALGVTQWMCEGFCGVRLREIRWPCLDETRGSGPVGLARAPEDSQLNSGDQSGKEADGSEGAAVCFQSKKRKVEV